MEIEFKRIYTVPPAIAESIVKEGNVWDWAAIVEGHDQDEVIYVYHCPEANGSCLTRICKIVNDGVLYLVDVNETDVLFEMASYAAHYDLHRDMHNGK